jgi:hypothetical protein
LLACSATVPAGNGLQPGDAAYVVLGEGGRAVARVVTGAVRCPVLQVGGAEQPMQTRVAADAVVRPGQAKPADFRRVCEAPLAPGASSARVGGRSLPLPVAEPRRIVVIGDTGCRIKAAEQAYQDCSDPQQWPFATIAAAAARENPDLVLHVGDYHYRESECPASQICAGSVWGYGWEAWQADFFAPARPLLAAAPWVVTRGNHEECSRAGQGWFRMLEARPYAPQRSCDDPRDDAVADFSEPYAVPLGGHWQLVVFDSAVASRPPDPARPRDRQREARYREQMQAVAALAAAPDMHSIFVSHHPVLGFTVGPAGIEFGNPALLQAMRAVNGTAYFPAGIALALHGHVHAFEAIDFNSAHPASIVAGHGGDNLDAELSGAIAATYPQAEGVRIGSVAHSSSFGYLLLERQADGWTVHARRSNGSPLTTCHLRDAQLSCGAGVPQERPAGAPSVSLVSPRALGAKKIA